MKELKDLGLKKSKELRTFDAEKLAGEIKEKEKTLYSFNMKLALGEVKQTHTLKFLRRYIARLKTLHSQKS